MPKTNQGGATAAGFSGIVEHGAPLADGRTLSELDPERNLDGTLIEGEHPDHPKGEQRETFPVATEPQPIEHPDEETDDGAGEPAEKPATEEKEEKSSPGINSRTSSAKTSPTLGKTSNRR